MDVIYSFRYDAKNYNTQLKYSLRSLEKYAKGVDNVYIIGFKPNLNIKHFEFPDTFGAAKNIMLKVLHACNQEISDEFLYIADDHYFYKETDITDYPYYYDGTLTELYKRVGRGYGVVVRNTIDLIGTGFNFNIHCPIRYNKTVFKEMFKYYNLKNNIGVLSKSVYCKFAEVEYHPMQDLKIRNPISFDNFRAKINGRHIFSTGYEHKFPELNRHLEKLFPDKSSFEW